MALVHTPVCEFGLAAPDFELLDVSGQQVALRDVAGEKGTLVMFICNHCPYVIAIRDRLIREANELMALGVSVIAINANDADSYPDDSYANMQRLAKEYGYPFHYLYDETQAVANAYGAVCTPDFFGYNAALELQYRGRLDESERQAGPVDARRDLFLAMQQVAQTGEGPVDQVQSMGCSIKWRNA